METYTLYEVLCGNNFGTRREMLGRELGRATDTDTDNGVLRFYVE